ncbi:hypothetical protein KG892_02565 [Vermiphilus pyriformis]|nr:MAG: hypothetical protein KG892_02565 [Vermiphilus pyriformis]
MKLRLIYTTIALYGCSAYSADLTKQPISAHMLPNTNIQDPYRQIQQNHLNSNPQLLQEIIAYLSTQSIPKRFENLSLVDLVHLYQEAASSLDNTTLADLHNRIVTKLHTKDALNALLIKKENLHSFISACRPATQTTLAQALSHPSRSPFSAKLYTYLQDNYDVKSFAVHPDGTVFSHSSYNQVYLWKFDGNDNMYKSAVPLKTSDTGNPILYLNQDGTLFMCDYSNFLEIWKSDEDGVYGLAQTAKSEENKYSQATSITVHSNGTVFLGIRDKTVTVWKADKQDNYQCVQTLLGHTAEVSSVAVHENGTLFSVAQDGTITIWKMDRHGKYKCVENLTIGNQAVIAIAVHTDGTLFSVATDGTINVWQTNEHNEYDCIQTLLIGETNKATSIAVHTDGTLFSGAQDGTVKTWKVNEHGAYECIYTRYTGSTTEVTSIVINGEGTLCALSGKIIYIWRTPVLSSLEQHILVKWLYQSYQDNNKQQIQKLSNHIESLYKQLPEAVKQQIIVNEWYKPTPSL